jgi:hypothetical protein
MGSSLTYLDLDIRLRRALGTKLRNKNVHKFCLFIRSSVAVPYVGRDSSVGIATGYGLDGPGIESR